MIEKKLIPVARTLSLVFTPFYLPLISMIALFLFTYLGMLPWQYKMQVILGTYLFTILLPTLLIHAYRKYNGWSFFSLRVREKRMIPYVISIICYFCAYYLMRLLHLPHFMSDIMVAALFVQIVCAIVNIWFKVSTHMAAIGGMTGGVIAFSMVMGFNAIWWVSALIILSGMLGTSRMLLRIHTLNGIITGFLIGAVTTFTVIIML